MSSSHGHFAPPPPFARTLHLTQQISDQEVNVYFLIDIELRKGGIKNLNTNRNPIFLLQPPPPFPPKNLEIAFLSNFILLLIGKKIRMQVNPDTHPSGKVFFLLNYTA